ncbi:hypothetical protein QTG54_014870 [Skeletonema marinoi]|uniref:Uncharacterized protein n=1 Tax=Skeletonema marinoi TaxID=267567 RepID=A0AAD8XVB9_9STRA|nr:hypothetical protein QTG54_014870 [Skeletonema marinoi]
MGLFTKSKSSEGSRAKSWIPEAIEFELGDTTNDDHNESASALGASNLGASLSSAFLLDGVGNDNGGNNNAHNNNARRPPPPSGAAAKGGASQTKNPFDTLEYDSSSDEDNAKKPPPSRHADDAMKSNKLFAADMKQYEEKLTAIENHSNFVHDDDDDGSSNSSGPLSGIEEGSGEASSNNNVRRGKKIKQQRRGSSKLKGLFGRKSSKSSSKLQHNQQQQQQQHHDEEGGSYISGEYDEEFDNEYGLPPQNNNNNNNNHTLAIGVPNPKGGKLTTSQLEDQLYLYKLETLNLTDACRELSDQLEETEEKLESVQAQATFRIHALEAELQDGNVGLKSLVKMTSTEMDGRLDALRALGKTATIQADKLKRRDHELQNVEQQLRRTRRDIKTLKRENAKVLEEKNYLKERLNEVESVRGELEETLDRLQSDQAGSVEKVAAEGKQKVDICVKKLNDALEELVELNHQIDLKDREIGELNEQLREKDGEIDQMKESLEMKEHDIVRVELQLEKVRNDLLEAASAAKTAEEARVEAVERENRARSKLEETSNLLADEKTRVATLERREDELKSEIEAKTMSAEEERQLAMQKAKLQELEEEVAKLREENKDALQTADAKRAAHESAITDRETQIDTLKQDIKVHQEQMQLAQNMLEEKENIASELHLQLVEAKEETKAKILELKDDLAHKSRELSNVNAELEDRTKDVNDLEKKLEQVRKEFVEKQGQVSEAAALPKRDGETEEPSSSETTKRHEALLAEKESQITRLDRELGTSKRHLDAMRVELDEKDKAVDRLKAKLDELKNKKDARVKELEAQLDGKVDTMESLRKELEVEKEALHETEDKLKNVQSDLKTALDASKDADALRAEAVAAAEESKAAESSVRHQCEKLKAQIDLLQKAKEKLDAELEASKDEREKESKSSTQAAAALAATNAARQAEMEMKIEKMQKEIDFKKREMDAIKSELREKEQAASRLKGELLVVRQEMANYKASIESEKEMEVLQRVADQDYFEDEKSSQHSISTGGSAGRSGGKFLGLFGRGSTEDIEDDDNIEWKRRAEEKDARIEQMQRTITANALTISNLQQELVTSSTKYKEDESQRRLLIQRLENENQAYSIKLEALEKEFNAIRQSKEQDGLLDAKREASFSKSKMSYNTDDGSVASSVNTDETGSIMSAQTGFTGVTSVTGASKYTPLERDNKKLKKQKKIYENRISSLQTQLSEIQLIVPELMSKSKSQITKLESVIQAQKDDSDKREGELKEEVDELKRQNAQLQAATRSRLQASDNNRQDEIDQLRMKLEAREATIAKLEIINKSFKKRGSLMGGKRKKKKKSSGGDGGSVVSDLSNLDTYSVAEDSVFSSFN